MAKTTIVNLDTVVDGVVSSNVNVQAANQAAVDAQAAASTATSKADEASNSAATAVSAASTAETYKNITVVKATEVDATVELVDAAKDETISAKNDALSYRNDALNYLSAVNAKYDQFDDRYLGALGSDPATDNDGQALIEGAIYWNMVEKKIKVYTGLVWVPLTEASGYLLATANLGDVSNAASARLNLDVYSTGEVDAIADTKFDKAGGTVTGDMTVTGSLTVSGSAVTVNAETVTTSDNVIVVNNGEVGAGVTNGSAGIEVDRGTETNYKFVFDETDDSFKVGEDGSLQKVATREDTPTDTGVASWDDATSKFVTSRDIDVDSITVSGNVDGRDVSADGATLDAHVAANSDVHGVTGNVVGTTDTQTLTNKTLNDVTNEIHADVLHYEIQATANITRGQCLVATGVTDDTIVKAAPRSSLTQPVIGIAEADISNGNQGEAISVGVLPNVPNTGSWDVGDVLYPNATGGFTTTPTIANGNYNQPIAYVVKANPAQVSLIVNVHSGHEYANLVAVNPVGNLESTNTQDALEELQGDVDSLNSAKVDKVTSTDNAVVRFDGTTGDVQDSTVLIDDTGKLIVNGQSELIGTAKTWTGAEEGTPPYLARHRFIVQGNNTSTFANAMCFVAGSNSYASLDFGDKDSTSQGRILYSNANDAMSLYVNNDEKVVIDSSGNVSVTGTVDGRDIAADGSKLDTLENDAAVKAQDVNTETRYTDDTTAVEYKIYMSNGQLVAEEL